MNKELSYQNSDDQEHYVQSELTIGKEQARQIKISAGTVAGSPEKPNEDAYAVTIDEGVLTVGIFDGCSSQKPIHALAPQTGARFASHFLKDSFVNITSAIPLKEGMLGLNKGLLDKNIELGGSLEDVHTLAATTGTIVRINPDGNYLEFAHIGDTFCVVYFQDGTSKLLTNDLNSKFDDEMFALIKSIAKERGISIREARKDERMTGALIDSFNRKFNNPNGQGTGYIDGDPNLEMYIQTGKIPLDGVSAVLLGSDGLPPQGWDQTNKEGREKLLNELHADGFQKLIRTKKQSEDDDPDWNYVRYKHSDDATGIFIEM